MSATVQPFIRSDLVSLGMVIDAVCAEGRWMGTSRFEPDAAWAHSLALPACPDHLLLIAKDAGQVVGWCRLFPVPGCNGPLDEGEVGIGLLPVYRGIGLGKALLGRALEWAGRRGMGRVTLTVRTDNARAIHLFRGRGFRRTGHEVGGWMEMEWQLRPPGGQDNG